MTGSIIKSLGAQPFMAVVRGLMYSAKPRHLRELAREYSLSPAGVSDIIRRLKEAGVLKEVRQGNRRCFSLAISSAESECLRVFFSIHERALLEERAARFSVNAADKLKWMDEAFEFYRDVKRLRHDAT